jgi:flagellar motility protein MotE (MotC chaperone)
VRTVRLLPVVIVAAGALLALKTIGLVTNGGYALTGVSEAVAAGGGGAPEQGAGAFTLPEEQTLSDSSPTLADAAPTIGGAADEADHGSGEGAEASAGHEAEAEAGAAEASAETETANADCLPAISPNPAAAAGNCSPEGEAVPMEIDASGNVVPLVSQDGVADTERELLERLAERRAELDAYAEELELRTALIEAAEKRVEERAATMEALEAQIAALVEERDAAEESLITGVVSMYETMRARDAATIFNDLDMEVLVQVAKAMAPRKMAPILAEMDPPRAQELTVRLAAIETAPPDELTADQLSELPQIVGQ